MSFKSTYPATLDFSNPSAAFLHFSLKISLYSWKVSQSFSQQLKFEWSLSPLAALNSLFYVVFIPQHCNPRLSSFSCWLLVFALSVLSVQNLNMLRFTNVPRNTSVLDSQTDPLSNKQPESLSKQTIQLQIYQTLLKAIPFHPAMNNLIPCSEVFMDG